MGSKRAGGLWISLAYSSAEQAVRILEEGSGAFTKAVPRSLLVEGASLLSLLSVETGKLNYIALLTGGSRISDLEWKVQIGPAIPLDEPLSVDFLFETLPKRVQNHVFLPDEAISPIPPGAWRVLLETVIRLAKVSQEDMSRLESLMKSRSAKTRKTLSETIAFERDAVATALDVFGGSTLRKKIISDAIPDSEAPFITRLRHRDIRLIEDQMITHDSIWFPGLQSLTTNLVGAIELYTNHGTLTVLNSNRTSIEKTLGVDLIYYNHTNSSFVLIQYKRLTGQPNPVYRPNLDPNLAKELERMREFRKCCSSSNSSYLTYRLNDNPFYLKLCKAQSPGDWNGRMLQGMYFPIDMWDMLMETEYVEGPQGGRRVSFESTPRRLSNSDFTSLVAKGWIGTNEFDTERLNDLLVELLASKHSVFTAIQQPRRQHDDYCRDQFGRFQSPEDEFAV